MNDPDDWHTWLAANPYPSLQSLAEKYGGAGRIPPDAWADYDRDMEAWANKRRDRLNATYAGIKRRL